MDGLEQNLESIGFIWILTALTVIGLVSVLGMFVANRRGRELPSWLVWFSLIGSWFLIEIGFANQAAVYQYSKRFVLAGGLPTNFSQTWIRIPAAIFRSALFNYWPSRLIFGVLLAVLSMALFIYFANIIYDAEPLALQFAVANCVWVAAMLAVFYLISAVDFGDRELALKFYISFVTYGLLVFAQWRIGSRVVTAANENKLAADLQRKNMRAVSDS